jgi:glycosyltransferase involved in cell wall biosynthesis
VRRLIIIGPLPPPYGGVAIHLQRLRGLLMEEGIEHRVFTRQPAVDDSAVRRLGDSRFNLLPVIAAVARRGVVHAHVTKPHEVCWVARLARLGIPVLLSVHSMGIPDALRASGDPVVTKLFHDLRRMRAIIVMNPESHSYLLQLGIPHDRLHVIPAFLPPNWVTGQEKTLPPAIQQALAEGDPILSCNAFSFDLYDGQLLYGHDMMLELASRLRVQHPGLRLLFIQSVAKGGVDEAWMRAEIRRRELERNVVFQLGGCDFIPVLARSDLFLRPTNTDGDALSIREALHLGVPALASDCVGRPAGTHLFRNRDMDDLERVCRECLDGRESLREKIRHLEKPDFGRLLLEILLRELRR